MIKETHLELKEAPEDLNLMPDCTGAMDELEEHVYKAAGAKYGDILPDEVSRRISTELDMIPSDIFAKYLLMHEELAKADIFSDGKRFCWATADNSFINYLLGITNLNPLSEELGGYGLEPEFFFGVEKKQATPLLDIVCRASKIDQVKEAIRSLPWVKDVVLGGIPGKDSSHHRFVVIAEGVDMDDLPIITLESGERVLGYDTYGIDEDKILICNINGNNRLDALADLEERIPINVRDIDPKDEKVSKLLMSNDNGLSTFFSPDSREYISGMTDQIKIRDMKDLTTIFALMTDTDVWYKNLQKLMKSGTVAQDDIIATREHCLRYLMRNGVGSEDAFRITESVRKGRGISDEDKHLLEMSGIPEWFMGFAGRVRFMISEAHAINNAKAIWEQAYFKEYYPNEYGAA